MSPVITGAVAMIVLLALMAIGMPVGFAMLFVGFVGFSYLVKLSAAFHVLTIAPYSIISNYDYCVLPVSLSW
jgi:C4-dicarboxylate transporter DctM subunit